MKFNKKYEFTGETINHDNRILRRVRRISDGLIGGFIESEDNLSHKDNAWVSGDAQVSTGCCSEKPIIIAFDKWHAATITDSIIQWGCRQFMVWDLEQFELKDCTEKEIWNPDVFETQKRIVLEAAKLKWGLE